MFTISHLSVNHNLSGEGVRAPYVFGWHLAADRRGARQAAYEIQLSADEGFSEVLWTSGPVASPESANVPVEGLSLAPSRVYWARARAVSDSGEDTGFCAPLKLATAAADFSARFVTAEVPARPESSRGTYLTGGFRAEGEIVSAVLHATALGVYHIALNGAKVGDEELAPGWTSYGKHLMYQTWDVKDMLLPGENRISAMVGAGWYKGRMGFLGLRCNGGDRTALMAQLEIAYRDGRVQRVVTDASWLGGDSPVLFSEIYDGETYDARLERDWRDTSGLHAAKELPFDFSVLDAQQGCRIRVMERLSAKELLTTPKGERVVDFGQNLTGFVHFAARLRPGQTCEMRLFEVLDADGNVYTANLRTAKETVRYTGRGGEAHFQPLHTFQGFRYAYLAEWPDDASAEDFTALVVYSDMERTGEFSCSNDLVNRLHSNILWSMKGNFLDVPTDCPQRDERMGWTGDAQIFSATACMLMDTYRFYEKWLRDLAADQTAEGGVPHVVPDIITPHIDQVHDWLLSQGTHSAAAWGDAAVINPWSLYSAYGDAAILRERYGSMKAWIDFMRSHADGVIWNYKLQFGDWVALDAEEGSYFGATPNDLSCTAYYAYSTGIFAKIAGILGNGADAAEYGALHDSIVRGFREKFFDRDGGMTAQTQTAHILALCFDLVPDAYREKTARRLAELLEKENGHLVTGFMGTPFFLFALSENGYPKEAVELLLKDDFPSWLYEVKRGATTVWEHWDGLKPDGTMWSPDMNSFNHYAYGAVGAWLYRVLAGLDCDPTAGAGYRRFTIKPLAMGFDRAEASILTPYGRAASGWTREGDLVTLIAEVPVGSEAEITLRGATEVLDADGLRFGEDFTARAVSGRYVIRYRA